METLQKSLMQQFWVKEVRYGLKKTGISNKVIEEIKILH